MDELNQPKYLYADILIALAEADGEVDSRERELLDGIFAEMGLKEDLVAEMWLTPRTMDVIESILSDIQDSSFKHCLLKDCYLLAYADEEVQSAENRFIERLCSILEIGDETTTSVHDWVTTAIAQRQRAQELFGAAVA